MFRKNLLVVLLTCLSLFSLAQSPLEFNYQAVARDQKGIPLDKREIKVRFSIRSNAPDGNVEYMEIRELETNPFGMFSVSIGSAGAYFSSGSLADVKWDNGKKFLQVEIDVKGGNDYKNLGATQMVSVPYALFALKSLDKESVKLQLVPRNGISINDSIISLGNSEFDTTSSFSENRVIRLNDKSMTFFSKGNSFKISKGSIDIQQDSILAEGESSNYGGPFMIIQPIIKTSDALPFLFSRMATQQLGNTVSPNEVVMWGHNLSPGGSNYIQGLPALGYSIESNYKPAADDRFVESHEYYVNDKGKQIRLKSYTINSKSDYIDFYHTVDRFYLKNHRVDNDYFNITTTLTNSSQLLSLGNLKMSVNNELNQIQLYPGMPNGELYLSNGNWDYLYLPGLKIEAKEKLYRLDANIIPESDSYRILGTEYNRFQGIYAIKYTGRKLHLKEGWASSDEITTTATLDIEGINGFNQFRLRKTYTPTGSSDPNGNTGDMSWDDNYIYIKTSTGWKRTSLESF